MPATSSSFSPKIVLAVLIFMQAALIIQAGVPKQPFFDHSEKGSDSPATLLLSRLNLNAPGLEKVKASAESNPGQAVAHLLTYYRNRTSVKHPADASAKGSDDQATPKEIQVANDALKHVFVGQPAYPSHFCGEDINWATNPYPDKEWVWQLNRMSFWEAMGKSISANGR